MSEVARATTIFCSILILLLGCGGEDSLFNPVAPTNRPLSSVSAADRLDFYTGAPAFTIDTSRTYIATIYTRRGNIVVALDAKNAPVHTNNFVFLSEQGFYDGLKFHRVEGNFVIQGGDPRGDGTGGPGYNTPAEIGLPHGQGVIAAARLGDEVNPERKSSGSQYYITIDAQPGLDGRFSVFGRVTAGYDIVLEIRRNDLMVWVEIEVR